MFWCNYKLSRLTELERGLKVSWGDKWVFLWNVICPSRLQSYQSQEAIHLRRKKMWYVWMTSHHITNGGIGSKPRLPRFVLQTLQMLNRPLVQLSGELWGYLYPRLWSTFELIMVTHGCLIVSLLYWTSPNTCTAHSARMSTASGCPHPLPQ